LSRGRQIELDPEYQTPGHDGIRPFIHAAIQRVHKIGGPNTAKEKEVEESKPADVAAEPAVSEEPVAETSAEEAVHDSEAIVAEEPATEA
jgi:hypothetical protein